MHKNELKNLLISECIESDLSHGEVKQALDDARMYFFLQEENLLKEIPVKKHSEQKAEKSERFNYWKKTEKNSNLALGFSIVALLLVIFIEFVVK